MNFVQRLEQWGEHHHPKWMDIVRMVLGIFLLYKGLEFAMSMSTAISLLNGNMPFSGFMLAIIGHYIVFAHSLGGFLLATGLLTRFACLIQIPVLLGAIFFVNLSPDMMRPFSELLLSIVVLLLLVYFFIIGSGPWSLDRAIERSNRK